MKLSLCVDGYRGSYNYINTQEDADTKEHSQCTVWVALKFNNFIFMLILGGKIYVRN
jgi:hypothetical protein